MTAAAHSVMAEAIGTAAAVYYKPGLAGIEVEAVIDRDVQVMDDAGGYTRMDTVTIPSGVVTPERDDEIEVGTDRWFVDQLDSDDGHLMRIFVRPESAQ